LRFLRIVVGLGTLSRFLGGIVGAGHLLVIGGVVRLGLHLLATLGEGNSSGDS
jgi:hypothetical protein